MKESSQVIELYIADLLLIVPNADLNMKGKYEGFFFFFEFI